MSHHRPVTGGGTRPTHTRTRAHVSGFLEAPTALTRLAARFAEHVADAVTAPPEQPEPDAAPWMTAALGEIGVAERRGMYAHNPRILEYFKASGFWGEDDSGGKNAWCGSFVAWVMRKHNVSPVRHAFRAKAWMDFGRKLESPVYGAIAVKSRRGGGHVGFVVGQSADGTEYYVLGGNQQDQVQILRYPANVWTTFVVPLHYDTEGRALPVRTDPVPRAGTES